MTARISLFQNQFKKNQNHPDLRGEIHIPVSLIQELAYYVNNNQRISPGYGQNAEPGVTIRVSVWAQQPNPQKPNGPVLTGSLESPAETDRKAQARAAAQPAPAAPQQQWAPPQPQAVPAPGPQYAPPQPPAPAYGQAPPPPYGQPAPAPQYAPPAQPPAPPAPAYGQPPAPAGYGQPLI